MTRSRKHLYFPCRFVVTFSLTLRYEALASELVEYKHDDGDLSSPEVSASLRFTPVSESHG